MLLRVARRSRAGAAYAQQAAAAPRATHRCRVYTITQNPTAPRPPGAQLLLWSQVAAARAERDAARKYWSNRRAELRAQAEASVGDGDSDSTADSLEVRHRFALFCCRRGARSSRAFGAAVCSAVCMGVLSCWAAAVPSALVVPHTSPGAPVQGVFAWAGGRPEPGGKATFYYNRDSSDLCSKRDTLLHIACNGWDAAPAVIPLSPADEDETAELQLGPGDWYRARVDVPERAKMLNFVLSDAERELWDNNGSTDFHTATSADSVTAKVEKVCLHSLLLACFKKSLFLYVLFMRYFALWV